MHMSLFPVYLNGVPWRDEKGKEEKKTITMIRHQHHSNIIMSSSNNSRLWVVLCVWMRTVAI